MKNSVVNAVNVNAPSPNYGGQGSSLDKATADKAKKMVTLFTLIF